jgi:hypothetical protein
MKMTRSEPDEGPSPSVGLCLDCAYGRKIETPSGSIFHLCERSFTEPGYPKYPRLPVVVCSGYLRSTERSLGISQDK